jgi:hypothetical protein
VLVTRSPWFGLFALTGYLHTWELLAGRWRVARVTTNREAARRLFISEASVKAHLLHVYTKLGVNDRAAAVAAAYERGLLTPGGG